MSRIRSIRHMAFKVFLGFNGLICQTYIPYLFLGLWNRLFGGWRSVLFCYAGSRDFVRSYAPPMVEPFFRWRPSPIGVLSHNGSRGLVIA